MLLQVHPHLLFLLLLLLLLVLLLALLLVQPPSPTCCCCWCRPSCCCCCCSPTCWTFCKRVGIQLVRQQLVRLKADVSIPPPCACPSALRPPESGATQEQQVATPLPPDLSAEHVSGFRIFDSLMYVQRKTCDVAYKVMIDKNTWHRACKIQKNRIMLHINSSIFEMLRHDNFTSKKGLEVLKQDCYRRGQLFKQ